MLLFMFCFVGSWFCFFLCAHPKYLIKLNRSWEMQRCFPHILPISCLCRGSTSISHVLLGSQYSTKWKPLSCIYDILPIKISVDEWTSFCIPRVRKFKKGVDPDLDHCGLFLYTGLGWNRVTFLCRRLCGPIVQTCDQSVGNIARLLLLLSSI